MQLLFQLANIVVSSFQMHSDPKTPVNAIRTADEIELMTREARLINTGRNVIDKMTGAFTGL